MEATARRAALLVAANAVQLPSAAAPDRGADAPPGPTVPTHVAGYLKRLLRAFKSGVPLRKLVEETEYMQKQEQRATLAAHSEFPSLN